MFKVFLAHSSKNMDMVFSLAGMLLSGGLFLLQLKKVDTQIIMKILIKIKYRRFILPPL